MYQRMIGAAKLRPETYEEVEADRSATLQATTVVVLAALATGIGLVGVGGVEGLWVGFLVTMFGWAVWAGVTYMVGTTILSTPQTRADLGELARTLGYAHSPGVLRVFGVIPAIGLAVFWVVSVWQLVAMVIAIRQALDYTSTWRAAGVAIIGFVANAVLTNIVFARL